MKQNKKNGWDVAGLVFGIVLTLLGAFASIRLYGSNSLEASLQHAALYLLDLLIASHFLFVTGVLTTIHYGKQLSKEKEAK